MAYPPFHPGSASLVKRHLTPARYQRLKDLKTPSGFTLDDAIRSGLTHPDSSVGIYAGDSDSYTLFSEIFTPIIKEYHGLGEHDRGHVQGMTPVAFPPLDPGGGYIRSIRIRVARNLAGVPFSGHITRADRLGVENRVIEAVKTLPPALSGSYTRFSELSPEELDTLTAEKLAFPQGDRFQEAAGMNRDFPSARGIFISTDKRFRVWVNEEDHLRIMALEEGSDLGRVLRTLVTGLTHLEGALGFAFDPALGYMNACPTNLGTAMRAGVHIHLPGLSRSKGRLEDLVHRHHLQIRGTMGEKTAVEDAVFDISNARRLGASADEILEGLYRGIAAIIQAEKTL